MATKFRTGEKDGRGRDGLGAWLSSLLRLGYDNACTCAILRGLDRVASQPSAYSSRSTSGVPPMRQISEDSHMDWLRSTQGYHGQLSSPTSITGYPRSATKSGKAEVGRRSPVEHRREDYPENASLLFPLPTDTFKSTADGSLHESTVARYDGIAACFID